MSHDLSRLKDLVVQLQAAQAKVDELTQSLHEAEQSLRYLSDNVLPEFMDEVGLQGGLKVEGGTLELEDMLTVSVPAERREEVALWLKEIDQESVMKTLVTVVFGKGKEREAEELRTSLEQQALLATKKIDINTSTLKSIVRRRLEEGKSVPMDTVGAHLVRRARVKRPRASKQFDGE